MRIFVVLAFGALFPIAAAAQDGAASCICEIPAQTSGTVAVLDTLGGQVLLAGAHGYAPAESGAELSLGDQVILLNQGRALLTAGATCRARLGGPALVTIVGRGSHACVAESALAVSVEPAQAPPGQLLSGAQGGLAGLRGAGFFTGLGEFLGSKGVADGIPARVLDEHLPVSP